MIPDEFLEFSKVEIFIPGRYNKEILRQKMRKIWERKSRSYEEAEEFDTQFWRKAGVQARWEATWMMVVNSLKMRGKSGRQLRLQRDIQRVRRIKFLGTGA